MLQIRTIKAIFVVLAFALFKSTCLHAQWFGFDEKTFFAQRKEIPQKDFLSYYLFPTYYSVPGVGSGVGAGFALSYNDLSAVALAVRGSWNLNGILLDDIPFFSRNSTLSMYYLGVDKGYFDLFDRGIDSRKTPLLTVKLKDSKSSGLQYNYYFHNKQIKLYAGVAYNTISASVGPGNIDNYEDLVRYRSVKYRAINVYKPVILRVGADLDNTDFSINPKEGFRFNYQRYTSLTSSNLTFNVDDLSYSKYITYNKITYAFNGFYSQSSSTSTKVLDQYDSETDIYNCVNGNESNEYTDNRDLVKKFGLAKICSSNNDAIREYLQGSNQVISSTTLGGATRLRGYPVNRFYDSHTYYGSAEIRYQLYNLPRLFDLFIQRGFINEIQLSAFVDTGSVSNYFGFKKLRNSIGVGANFVFSGAVLRLNYAYTDEGGDFIAFLGQAF